MAVPEPVIWAAPEEPSSRPVSASGTLASPALNSYNYFSGTASGDTVNYSDLASFAWWIELTKLCVEYIGAVCMDRNRVVTDRIVPGGGEGKILPGTRWELANAPGEYTGGCLTGDLVVSRPLNVLPRALIAIEVVGTNLQTQRVYLGRIDSPPMNTKSRDPDNGEIVEAFKYHLVGPKAYASDSYLLGRVYEEQDVGAIFRDIVQNHLAVKSPVIYNEAKIVDTGYTVAQQAFQNTKILSALDTLAQLAGEYVWGVDVDGEAYLAPRQASSDHHFWLDRHRVTLEKLDRDTDNIRNAIYVETPTESGGERIYYLLEDELSIEEWGRVEQVVAMPSSVVDLEDIMVTDVTSNKTIIDEENMYDGYTSGTYARIEDVVVDDYIDVHLNTEATITGFTFHQSSGLMAYYYSIREIEVQRLDGTFITRLSGLTPSTTVSVPAFTASGFRLVVKEANTTGTWSIREISVTLGNLSDPAQYGASLLSLWKEPILVGTLAIDDGCFITPTGIRLTDALGTSYSFDVDQMTYELEDDGLHIKASVGKGQLNLARALALANTQISTVEESVRNSDTEGVTTEPIVDLSGLVTGGLNVGTGAEVYKATSDQEMQFRTLRSSDGSIGITQNEDDIDLAALGGGASELAELDDVSEDAPLDGQVLVWDDTTGQWIPDTIVFDPFSLDDLTDVDTTTTPPGDGQALVWDNAASTWKPATIESGGDTEAFSPSNQPRLREVPAVTVERSPDPLGSAAPFASQYLCKVTPDTDFVVTGLSDDSQYPGTSARAEIFRVSDKALLAQSTLQVPSDGDVLFDESVTLLAGVQYMIGWKGSGTIYAANAVVSWTGFTLDDTGWYTGGAGVYPTKSISGYSPSFLLIGDSQAIPKDVIGPVDPDDDRVLAGVTADRPDTSDLMSNETLIYFDTSLGKLIIWNGSAWVNTDGSAL